MTKRIDHVAESENINEYLGENFIAEQGFTDATAIMGSIDSLRHAVLALVEQQRIANIIALGKYTHADGSRGFQHVVTNPVNEYSVALNDDIREGLGL